MPERWILHVDMDAFYASVEQRDNPELRGKPVIVGGGSNRGVVAAASYEVRRYGVHSAMPTREALRRCPDAICVRPRMGALPVHLAADVRRLSRVHAARAGALARRGVPRRHGERRCTRARHRRSPRRSSVASASARELSASVGVAPNKLVAKIASDLRKPDGLVVVPAHEVNATLDPLPIRKLFGLGAKTAPKVEALGIHTLGELRRAPSGPLRPIFGRYVELLQQRAAGIDDRPVIANWDEKQISAEETFDEDIADRARLHAELARLADRACARLRAKELAAGCVNVKIRRSDFSTCTRQRHIEPPTQETRVVTAVATALLDAWLTQQPRAALRLLGVGVTELAPSTQLELFTVTQTAKNRELDGAVDRIREKFGRGSLTRGGVSQRELKPGSK